MTGEEVLELAKTSSLNVAATVKPNGKPHIATSGVVVVNDMIFIGADTVTRRFKNLEKNPGIALLMADGWKRRAILEGEARFLDMNSPTAQMVKEAQMKRQGWTTESVAETIPDKIFTWKAPSKKS